MEFRLFWEGHVNRSDVMTQFGLSVNQASSDLSHYIDLAPHNMYCDRRPRTYVRQPDFKPVFNKLDAGRYLAQLRSVAEDIFDQDDCWIAGLPACDAAPTTARGVDPTILRSVVETIRRSEAIEVKYQSPSSTEPRWRWIAPHAIGFDGVRWPAGAFCLTDEVFKDVLLSCILDICSTQQSGVLTEDGLDWHISVTLEIGLRPGPSKTRAKVIEVDYGMRGGKAKVRAWRTLPCYALRRLGLDTATGAWKPQDQQIALLNR